MPKKWNFLSNHGLVILHIVRNRDATLRQIALATGLTERAVYQIVRALEEGAFIGKRKVGRRNTYSINEQAILSHPVYDDVTLADIGRALVDLAAQPVR